MFPLQRGLGRAGSRAQTAPPLDFGLALETEPTQLRAGLGMNLVEQVRQAGVVGAGAAVAAGRQVLAEAGVLVNAVVISRPHPDVYREVV